MMVAKNSIFLSILFLVFACNTDKTKLLEPTRIEFSQCANLPWPTSDIEFFHFSYFSDSLKVKGVLGKPKDLDKKKLPVIVYNRGYTPTMTLTDCRVGKLFPPMVNKGFVLIAPQYRGWAGGEGNDEFGGKDLNDLRNIIDLAKKLDFVDSKNIFMIGASRGGMTTYMYLRKNRGINAASVFGGVVDQFTETLDKRSDGMEFEFRKMIPNYEKNKYSELKKRSAIYWAKEIKTPLLIQHGKKDFHVDYKQAVQMAGRLKNLGSPHKLVLFENGDHCCQLDPLDPLLKTKFNNRYWKQVVDNSINYFVKYLE